MSTNDKPKRKKEKKNPGSCNPAKLRRNPRKEGTKVRNAQNKCLSIHLHRWTFVFSREVLPCHSLSTSLSSNSVFGNPFQWVRIDFGCPKNQFLHLELILGEVKIFYFLSKSLLEVLPNINYFTSKPILTKLILTKSILQKQNQTHTNYWHGQQESQLDLLEEEISFSMEYPNP